MQKPKKSFRRFHSHVLVCVCVCVRLNQELIDLSDMGVNSAGLFNSSPIMEVSHAFGRRAGTGQVWPDKSAFMRASYSFYG